MKHPRYAIPERPPAALKVREKPPDRGKITPASAARIRKKAEKLLDHAKD